MDRLTISGKLEARDPARLALLGVKHVINLAMGDHAEALADEAELLAQQGIAYTHIPVPFDAPSRDHVAALRQAMTGSGGPVHVHCIMNYRVTAFLYLLDLEDGVDEQQARAAMLEVWDPLTSDHPASAPWREFLVAQCDNVQT